MARIDRVSFTLNSQKAGGCLVVNIVFDKCAGNRVQQVAVCRRQSGSLPAFNGEFQQEGHAMKRAMSTMGMSTMGLFALLAGALFVNTGCATPGYSALERNQMIARNWDYEIKQASDDWDYLLLLRPASRLTIWNVR
jgi:hypothetical protein